MSEEKAMMATSKVEALEAKASGLRKDLIVAMDEKQHFQRKDKNFN